MNATLEIQIYNEEWTTRFTVRLTRIIQKDAYIWKSYRIGRSPECEILVDWVGSLISRFQATLIRNQGDPDYWIIDGLPNQASRNGIKVNGQKVAIRKLLSHGDIITLCPSVRGVYYNPPTPLDNLEATLTEKPT